MWYALAIMGRRGFRTFSHSKYEHTDSKHRFEHWYRDNTVYFITSNVRDGYFAFESEEAKSIFWDRLNFYCAKYEFIPWIATLMINHYHIVGYLKHGENLGPFMQHLHGSVAKARERHPTGAPLPILAHEREQGLL